jgi:hypothetical protein
MNPTPEYVKQERWHYELMTTRWMAMWGMLFMMGFVFFSFYIWWLIDPSDLSIAYDRGQFLGYIGLSFMALSLPLLFFARSNYKAMRKVK